MSKENVQLFFEKVKEDEELQKVVNQLFETSEREIRMGFIQLGSDLGYFFSEADLVAFQRDNIIVEREGQLNDNQLERIAGGFVSREELEKMNPHLVSTWTKC